MTDEQAQRVFLALADPTRRLLLQHLCEEGSGTAAGFATRLPITRQAIIKHRSNNQPKQHIKSNFNPNDRVSQKQKCVCFFLKKVD